MRPWPLVSSIQISLNSKAHTIPFGIVACTSPDSLSRNSFILFRLAYSRAVDFLRFLQQKRAKERDLVLRAGANYRIRKWEAKDFKKVFILFSLLLVVFQILNTLYPSSNVHSTPYLAHWSRVEILLTPLSFSHMRSSTHLRGTLERRGSGEPTVKSLPKKQLRSNICNNTKQKRENVSASS